MLLGRVRGHILVAVCLAGLVCLSGCTAEEKTDFRGPYAAQVEQAYNSSSSSYIRGILADGTIDSFEINDAMRHVVECVSEAGFTISYTLDNHSMQFESTTPEPSDEVLIGCQDEWLGEVGQLYWSMYTNPNNENGDGLVAACLVRKGLAPAEFTGTDYAELTQPETIIQGTGEVFVAPEFAEIIIPGGGSLSDPEAVTCAITPLA